MFSNSRLLSRQNPTVKPNIDWFWSCKESYTTQFQAFITIFKYLRWRSTKHMKGIELIFVVSKPKELVEKQRLNQTRTSCTPNDVSSYGPYLKSKRSNNFKISFVGKKIRFSTISPEIKIFEFARFLPQIWPAISRLERNQNKEGNFLHLTGGKKAIV